MLGTGWQVTEQHRTHLLYSHDELLTDPAQTALPAQRKSWGDRVVLRPDPQSPGVARAFVGGACARWGIEPLLDSAQLVVSELVTNAVSNARGSNVTVDLRLHADHLRIEVEDEDSRLPLLQRNDWEALGGRGLVLIEALSRDWGCQPCPAGKIVWAELALAG